MIKIYIPTKDRVDKQTTYNNLTSAGLEPVLVCPTEEAEQHVKRGRSVIVCDAKGIGATRDEILANARGLYPKILMMDDDLKIQRRREDGRITDASPIEIQDALIWMDDALDHYAHAAFGPRFLAYNAVGTEMYNARMLYTLGYDMRKLTDERFCKDMEQPSTMEDFNMTLQLLTKGHENVVSLEWRLSNSASNSPGGCSTWRTTAIQTKSAKRLAELYPKFVKIRLKKEWQGMEGEMFDVTIQWKKAFEHGNLRRNG